MQKFDKLTGLAAPIDEKNIDTDQLTPARFLMKSRADGYAKYLFYDRKFDAEGIVESAFDPQSSAVPRRKNPNLRRKFWLRLVARACGLGTYGFRHTRRHRAIVRPHLFSEQHKKRTFSAGHRRRHRRAIA